MTMIQYDPLRFLSHSLRDVVQQHVGDETALLSIAVAPETFSTIRGKQWGLSRSEPIRQSGRAFVLTTQRALILEDPNDPTPVAERENYLIASCPLKDLLHIEVRSHRLDYALTLVMPAPDDQERITLRYNEGSSYHFLNVLACIRALVDHQPLPFFAKGNETSEQKQRIARKNWIQVLAGLPLRQQNVIMRYLAPFECIKDVLVIPTIDESTWWQRFLVATHEQPPALLVCTHRQVLMIREVKCIVRSTSTYGSDARLIPLTHLHGARIIPDSQKPLLALYVGHETATEVLHLPLPPALANVALSRVWSCLATGGEET